MAGRARLIKSRAYREWLAMATLAMVHEPSVAPKTPCVVRIDVAMSRKRDVDNVAKPILDALQGAGVIPDDRYVDALTITRIPRGARDPERARIHVARLRPSPDK